MKKIIYLLYFIFIILLYNLNSNNILLTISLSLFTIIISIFNNFKLEDIINNYHNKKEYYSINKIYKYSLIYIIIIGIIFTVLIYIMSLLINIKYLFIVNFFMVLASISITIIKFTSIYLKYIGYNKNKLFDIYKIINVILLFITSVLSVKVFKFDNYINDIILYSNYILTTIIIMIILYFTILRHNKYLKTREEKQINYIKLFKKINSTTIFNVIKYSYIYISIIILYYVLINKYYYTNGNASKYISAYYLFGIIFIYYIYLIIKKLHLKEFTKLKESIINKKIYNINNFINKVIRNTLHTVIFLMVLSGPISYILFKNNIIFDLMIFLLFYIIFDTIININIICNKEKNIFIILIIGLISKIIFEIPLIEAANRMGYNLIFGSVLANALGFVVSSIIGIIILKKKMKLTFLDNFENILNIIYEAIIYSLILVLFTFIINIKTKSLLASILAITFYSLISIFYIIIRRKTIKK